MNFIYNLKTLKRNIFLYKRQGMHVSAMEARLKEPWKPLLNMGLCSQRLAGMLGAPSISGFCKMKIFQ